MKSICIMQIILRDHNISNQVWSRLASASWWSADSTCRQGSETRSANLLWECPAQWLEASRRRLLPGFVQKGLLWLRRCHFPASLLLHNWRHLPLEIHARLGYPTNSPSNIWRLDTFCCFQRYHRHHESHRRSNVQQCCCMQRSADMAI